MAMKQNIIISFVLFVTFLSGCEAAFNNSGIFFKSVPKTAFNYPEIIFEKVPESIFNHSYKIIKNVTEPYDINFNNTIVGSKKCTIDIHRISYPFFAYGALNAEWDLDEIRRAMNEAGMTKIYGADIHIFSIFLDIYKKKSIILYGD